jgi:threonylcarbamoyladenosine tRNA methylthiotransferase MtaB
VRIAFVTLGCRTNQAESTRLEQMISDRGHQIVDLSEGADICIINTCSVTEKADHQSRQSITRAIKAKTEVIVTGCYAELNNKSLKEKNPGIKVICNNAKCSIINLIPYNSSSSTLVNSGITRKRPTIKVQDGCNNACSYCIIPSARGRSRSVYPQEIIGEIRRLESLGFEEIVLSGIHLGLYGKDLTIDCNLATLLEEIINSTKITRIRLSSIEINEFNDHLLQVIQHDRVCKHLHIPLQSADDDILVRMNRSYNVKEYGLMLNKISRQFSNISIGTDIIVGFPTEEERHFNNMMTFLDSQPFTYLHVFPFSSRPGTAAATLKPIVPNAVKKLRVSKARELSARKKITFWESNIGLEHIIIAETLTENGIVGTTSNYIKVFVPMDYTVTPGMLVRIRIAGVSDGFASGHLVNNVQPPGK